MARQIISIRIDPATLAAADRRAAAKGISRSEHLSRLAARDALTASAAGPVDEPVGSGDG